MNRFALYLCLAILWSGVAFSQSEVGEQTAASNVFQLGELTRSEEPQNSEIRIEGGSGEARAAISGFYRSVKADFRNLYPVGRLVETPLNVRLKGRITDIRSGPSTMMNVEILPDDTYLIVLDVFLHANFDNGELERRFIESLLLDRMYAPQRTNGLEKRSRGLPAWLIVGTQELIKHRRSGRHSEAYAQIAQSLEMLPVQEIITAPEPAADADSMTREIYSASAAALVAAFSELADGSATVADNLGERMKGAEKVFEFLAKLPYHQGDQIGLLRETFPELRGSAGALDKWWALQIAAMGKLSAFEFYSWEQTRDAMNLILAMTIPAETTDPEERKGLKKYLPGSQPAEEWTGNFRDFDEYLDHPNAAGILRGKKLLFEQLRHRGFPLYRRVAEGYERAAELLARDEKRGVKKALEQLDSEFMAINQSMSTATDVMNHFEATQIGEKSPDFEKYRRVEAQLERDERARELEGSDDPFSKYLKEFEAEFE